MNRSAKQNDLELEKQQKKNELKLKVNTHNCRFSRILKRQTITFPSNGNNRAYKTVQALDLKQKHLRRLKKRFDSIDIDKSGSIDYDELFAIMDENRSPFTDSLFALIDVDKSGRIEFCEFVSLCATYCIYTKEDVLRFCFDCFDKDGSGTIDEMEYKDLCKTVNSPSPMFPGNFIQALNVIDSDDDGLIDFDEFVDFDRKYPLLLFPAFRLQQRMQILTLGEKTWMRINESIAESIALKNYIKSHEGRRPYLSLHRMLKGKMRQIFGKTFCVSLYDIEKLKDRPSHLGSAKIITNGRI